jgi:hypothetical protein
VEAVGKPDSQTLRGAAHAAVSGARKPHQRHRIPRICLAQGCKVPAAGIALARQVVAAPRERGTAKVLDQAVCAESRVPAVAVREGVDADELVVEIDGELVGILALPLDPKREVAADLVDASGGWYNALTVTRVFREPA